MMEHQAGADADQNNADVLDRVKGEKAFEVMLHERVEHTEESRDHAHSKHEAAPPRGAAAQQIEREPQQTIDTHLDHAARHERRDMTRGGRMSAGQPDMQWDDAGLRAEAEEGQHEDGVPNARAERGCSCPQLGKASETAAACE